MVRCDFSWSFPRMKGSTPLKNAGEVRLEIRRDGSHEELRSKHRDVGKNVGSLVLQWLGESDLTRMWRKQ